MNGEKELRLSLALRLRELADGSNEVELRNALSRSWYAIYHAANVLFGKCDHHEVSIKVGGIDSALAGTIERLRTLRSQADYDPTFVEREFGGDTEALREEVAKRLDEARLVFKRLVSEIEKLETK